MSRTEFLTGLCRVFLVEGCLLAEKLSADVLAWKLVVYCCTFDRK